MLLLDENIAARLGSSLAELSGLPHVGDCGLTGASDLAIWQYARDHSLIIVSKDEDFQRLGVLYGAPPKVIWLRLGNCSTADISNLLVGRRAEIEHFLPIERRRFSRSRKARLEPRGARAASCARAERRRTIPPGFDNDV